MLGLRGDHRGHIHPHQLEDVPVWILDGAVVQPSHVHGVADVGLAPRRRSGVGDGIHPVPAVMGQGEQPGTGAMSVRKWLRGE